MSLSNDCSTPAVEDLRPQPSFTKSPGMGILSTFSLSHAQFNLAHRAVVRIKWKNE